MLVDNLREALVVNLVKQSAVVLTIGVAVAACGNEKKQPEGAAAPAEKPALKPDKAPEPTLPLTQLTQGFAKFKGDALIKCAQATVMFDAKLKPAGLTIEELVILFAEDALLAAEGEEGTMLGERQDKRQITSMFRKAMFETAANQQKMVEQVRAAMKEGLKPENLKKQNVVRVDACEFPNRVALGLCHVEDVSADFGWSAEVLHYDVGSTTDSDAGMKNCLAIAGKWTASDSRDAARERAKQHSRELHDRLQKHSQDLNRQFEDLKNMAND